MYQLSTTSYVYQLYTTYVCVSMFVFVLCTYCIFFLPYFHATNCQITLCLNEEWPIMSLCILALKNKSSSSTLHSLKKKVKWTAVIYHTYICVLRAIRLDRKKEKKIDMQNFSILLIFSSSVLLLSHRVIIIFYVHIL